MHTTQQLSRSKSAVKPGSHSSSLLAGRTVQAKLSVNEPGDDYEREADAMADHVMRSGAPPAGHTGFFGPSISAVQRKCQNCEEDDKEIQRKESSSRAIYAGGEVTSYSGSLSSKGPKLPDSSRNFFETSFARDFFGARNHYDTDATKPAQANAPAHTEKGKKLHRKETNAGGKVEGGNSLDNYVGSLGSSGRTLPENSRRFFEPHFGRDFSNVRIHTDSIAAKSAQSINALAYTTGNNIVFNQNQFSPESDEGKKLLAHELTHVVQQEASQNRIQKKPDKREHRLTKEAFEREIIKLKAGGYLNPEEASGYLKRNSKLGRRERFDIIQKILKGNDSGLDQKALFEDFKESIDESEALAEEVFENLTGTSPLFSLFSENAKIIDFFIYSVNNDGRGIIDQDSQSLKPSVVALSKQILLIKMLIDRLPGNGQYEELFSDVISEINELRANVKLGPLDSEVVNFPESEANREIVMTALSTDAHLILQQWIAAAYQGVNLFATSNLSNSIDSEESGSVSNFLLSLVGNTTWAASVFFPESIGIEAAVDATVKVVDEAAVKATQFRISMVGIGIASIPILPIGKETPLAQFERVMIKLINDTFDKWDSQVDDKAVEIVNNNPDISEYRALAIFIESNFPGYGEIDKSYKKRGELNKTAVSDQYNAITTDMWNKYKEQIEPIGEDLSSPILGIDASNELIFIKLGSQEALSLVEYDNGRPNIFISFIDKKLAKSAISKAIELHGQIGTFDAKSLQGVPKQIPENIFIKPPSKN